MTLKTFSVALVAATLLAPAAFADVTIIQSGPMPGVNPFAGHSAFNQQMSGSGFGVASAFIQNMVDSRMPTMSGVVADAIDADPIAAPIPEPIGFVGSWDLVTLYDTHASRFEFSEEMLAHAEFGIEADGRFNASAGCNSIFGTMAQTGGIVETGEIMATLMMCDEPGMSLERALIQSLSNASLFAHGHDRLVFLDSDGNPLARFAAQGE